LSQITKSMKEAITHHQAGRLQQAQALYRVVLHQVPGHADALHLVGLVAHQQGRHDEATSRIAEAIEANSGVASYHNNLGAAHRSAGRFEQAAKSFGEAISLQPTMSSAWSNLLGVLSQQGENHAVGQVLEGWVTASGGAIEVLQQRAAHRYAMGDLDGAIADHESVAERRLDDHIPCMHRAFLAHERGDDATALQAFHDAQDRFFQSAKLGATTVQSKLNHDIEQIHWLVEHGMVDAQWLTIADAYQKVKRDLYGEQEGLLEGRPLDAAMIKAIGPWYNRPIHVVDCPAISTGALGADWTAAEVEGRYLQSAPGVTWIDGLLKTDALQQLRRFCLGSTIWTDFKYSGGYVGTSLTNGFTNGLLLQIAREMRERLPGLLGPHPLRQMWAYKYDQELAGIGVHADSAAVNVNFWITPDEANLDTGSGGLRVWRKCAPLEWDFEEFNRRPEKLMEWVEESGAEEFSISHRCNRAVLFDSSLVHRTDDFQFAPGFENRRINITMLFGERGD
jgi:tetratricopeptide (TPR) repeat protein